MATKGNLDSRFAAAKSESESRLVQATIGLVSKEEFTRKRKELERKEAAEKESAKKKKIKKKKEDRQTLSFDADNEPGDDGGGVEVRTYGAESKEKQEKERLERMELERQYEEQKQATMAEPLRVAYNIHPEKKVYYTDVTKGDTIGHFIQKSIETNKMLGKTVDGIFVKEDLILPHTMTFYDIIAAGAKGRTGRLTEFDAVVDEGGRRKVTAIVDGKWYTKNRDVPPVAFWELFDLTKDYQKSWKVGQTGDWHCPACNILNWGSKHPKNCMRCNAPRPVFSAPLI